MRRTFFVTAVCLAVALWPPSVAFGSYYHYGVDGQAYLTSTSKVVGYGTTVNSLIKPKQTGQHNDWVNSIYAGNAYGNFYEAGWYWTASGSAPQAFQHWYSKSLDRHYEERLSATLTPNTVVQFRIVPTTMGGQEWRTFIGGVYKGAMSGTGVTSAYSLVGSERYDTLDANKGSWTAVQYARKTGTGTYAWTYWPLAYTNMDITNDPSWYFYSNLLNSPNSYKVYVDNHQN